MHIAWLALMAASPIPVKSLSTVKATEPQVLHSPGLDYTKGSNDAVKLVSDPITNVNYEVEDILSKRAFDGHNHHQPHEIHTSPSRSPPPHPQDTASTSGHAENAHPSSVKSEAASSSSDSDDPNYHTGDSDYHSSEEESEPLAGHLDTEDPSQRNDLEIYKTKVKDNLYLPGRGIINPPGKKRRFLIIHDSKLNPPKSTLIAPPTRDHRHESYHPMKPDFRPNPDNLIAPRYKVIERQRQKEEEMERQRQLRDHRHKLLDGLTLLQSHLQMKMNRLARPVPMRIQQQALSGHIRRLQFRQTVQNIALLKRQIKNTNDEQSLRQLTTEAQNMQNFIVTQFGPFTAIYRPQPVVQHQSVPATAQASTSGKRSEGEASSSVSGEGESSQHDSKRIKIEDTQHRVSHEKDSTDLRSGDKGKLQQWNSVDVKAGRLGDTLPLKLKITPQLKHPLAEEVPQEAKSTNETQMNSKGKSPADPNPVQSNNDNTSSSVSKVEEEPDKSLSKRAIIQEADQDAASQEEHQTHTPQSHPTHQHQQQHGGVGSSSDQESHSPSHVSHRPYTTLIEPHMLRPRHSLAEGHISSEEESDDPGYHTGDSDYHTSDEERERQNNHLQPSGPEEDDVVEFYKTPVAENTELPGRGIINPTGKKRRFRVMHMPSNERPVSMLIAPATRDHRRTSIHNLSSELFNPSPDDLVRPNWKVFQRKLYGSMDRGLVSVEEKLRARMTTPTPLRGPPIDFDKLLQDIQMIRKSFKEDGSLPRRSKELMQIDVAKYEELVQHIKETGGLGDRQSLPDAAPVDGSTAKSVIGGQGEFTTRSATEIDTHRHKYPRVEHQARGPSSPHQTGASSKGKGKLG